MTWIEIKRLKPYVFPVKNERNCQVLKRLVIIKKEERFVKNNE